MVTNAQVASLYGEVKNLHPFVHPEYGRRFRFMTAQQTIELAEQVLARIVESGISTVIVSESGASPLVWICRQLANTRGIQVNWHSLKIPRDPLANPFPVIMAYLNEDERISREENLRVVCSRIQMSEESIPLSQLLHSIERRPVSDDVKHIAAILKGTRIQALFSSPFLFFDEYIDSGTTLANAARYATYFAGTLTMKIGCYYLNVDAPTEHRAVLFALHSRADKLSCFEKGVYPFENRVDLIGYWYTSSATAFHKSDVADLISSTETDASTFMGSLAAAAADPTLLKQIQNGMQIRPVKKFCQLKHVMQYILYRLEAESDSSPEATEFLYQLFEMYAPIWSPLPDAYHIDFVSAFKPETVSKPVSSLLTDYMTHRDSILSAVARACETRRRRWRSHIIRLLHSL